MLQGAGLAWIAAMTSTTVPYLHLVPGFVMAGAGMALVFAPAANTVLGAVRPTQAGQASGATNAMRELGGVLGVSVLATVFSAHGGYASPQNYVDGLIPAVWVGSAVLFVGAFVALGIPSKRPQATGDRPQELSPARA
jgi:MFS family permease